MEVMLARHAGACYGVQRALDLAVAVIDEGREVRTLGPLIHNPLVVRRPRTPGARVAASVADIDGGTVIRSHGVTPAFVPPSPRARARCGRRDVPACRACSGRRRAACGERLPCARGRGGRASRGGV